MLKTSVWLGRMKCSVSSVLDEGDPCAQATRAWRKAPSPGWGWGRASLPDEKLAGKGGCAGIQSRGLARCVEDEEKKEEDEGGGRRRETNILPLLIRKSSSTC